jgi:hypothetical protein
MKLLQIAEVIVNMLINTLINTLPTVIPVCRMAERTYYQ